MQIDYLFATVSLIIQVSGSNLVGSATGFFFQDGTNNYLVSNRHVFTGETLPGTTPKPDKFILPLHMDSSNLIDSAFLTLPIRGTSNAPIWLEHPLGQLVDIAALPLTDTNLTNTAIQWLSEKNFPPKEFGILPGQDLFVMGYPQGFHDKLFNLPIIRNALASSAYGVPFEGNGFFLMDARLHPGSSGSPVFSKPTRESPDGGIMVGGRPLVFLVGINSGELKPIHGQTEALGLHAAWYPRLIMDVIHNTNAASTNIPTPSEVTPFEDILEKSGYSKQFFP